MKLRKLFPTSCSLLIGMFAFLVCMESRAQENDLLLHYDFSQVTGTTVSDQSASGVNARLVNQAKVETMGKYSILNLGNGSGYLDMTQKAGALLKSVDNYAVSLYYFVDAKASLSGNGYFLWAFSTSSACGSGDGKYSAYRLNAQRYATSTGGYSNEKGIQVGAESVKGRWVHVCYSEENGKGSLYIDGKLIGSLSGMPLNSSNYGTATPSYCWLGRAPFSGDSYLKQTLIADFRLYGRALTQTDISQLSAQTSDLEYEYYHGTPGDATALQAAITEAENLLASINATDYLPGAVMDIEDAVTQAKGMIAAQFSQTSYDEMTGRLKSAITTLNATKGLSLEGHDFGADYQEERGFRHPGGLHTQADFDRIKAQLAAGNPKVTEAYNILKAAEYAQPSVATWPVETIVRGGGSGENYINAARGATMAYQNALRWKIEGNRLCAAGAVRILMAWANNCKLVSGDSNWALAAGLYGYQFAQAAELVRDYSGWSKTDFEKFKKWMLTVWYPGNINFLRGRNGTWQNYVGNQGGIRPGHYWSNWPLCNVLAVMTIGVLCDDVFIYNQGLSFMKYDQVGTFKEPRTADPILNDGCTEFIGNLVVTKSKSSLETGAYGELGQMQESGRDGGHAAMALGLAVDIAHMAWNQGDDLFSYMDNRLAAGIEFVAACTQNVQNLPWTNYKYVDCRTAWHNGWLMPGPAEPAEVRNYWGTVIGHYEGVKGVKMPFAEKAYTQMGIDAGGWGGTSGPYDHLGYSVLMNTYDEQLCPEEKRPTLLTPMMEVDGIVTNHNELGGLRNTYVPESTQPVAYGKTVKLMPQLPVGEEDTGMWQWNTGQTTKDITITADHSYAYRATYTNKNGVESSQVFTIAVEGDCRPALVTGTITYEGETLEADTITVFYGDVVTLRVTGSDGWGSFLWDNGVTTESMTTQPIVRERDFKVAYISQGGNRVIKTFHVNVKYTRPDLIYQGATQQNTQLVIAQRGERVKLAPYVPESLTGMSYEWSTGDNTRVLTLDDLQTSGFYTVNCERDGKLLASYTYKVFVQDAEAKVESGVYAIRHIESDTYMTAMGSLKRVAFLPLEGDEPAEWQKWVIDDYDANGRYSIYVTDKSSYLSSTMLHSSTATEPFAFDRAAGSNYIALKLRAAGYYVMLDDDLTVNGRASKTLTDYPFELIPVVIDGIENHSLQPTDGQGSSSIFDLQGRKMVREGNLPKGIYVMNGKKVVVK